MAFFILESALRCELKQEEQQLKLCLGISSSHSCNSLEDAGLGLFVPSGAERAYFRLPCTLHSSVPLLYKAAELVRTAVHIEIWVYINELFIPFFNFRLAY